MTDNEYIVNAALRNDNRFPVAVSNVVAKKIKRQYTMVQQSDLDTKTASNLIGDIINCSQELNTMLWDKLNNYSTQDSVMPIYLDICKLNAGQTIEIDSAKKEFEISNAKELSILRNKYNLLDDQGKKIKPAFFAAKDKGKGYYDREHKNYAQHDTTMDYLQSVVNSWVYMSGRNRKAKIMIPFSQVVKSAEHRTDRISTAKIANAFSIVREAIFDENQIYALDVEQKTKFQLASSRRQECVEQIGNMTFGVSTMLALLEEMDKPENRDISRRVFHILFGYPNTSFFNVIQKSSTTIPVLSEDPEGDILIHDFQFKKA